MPRPAALRPAPQSELSIALTKHSDGSTIRLTRADGTATWQRSQGATGAFFPTHDLTHLAVDSTLGYRRGFYGLVVEGWNLEDFGAPWPRGRLIDIDPAELIVGFVDRTPLDRTGLVKGTEADAAALNGMAAIFFSSPRTDPASAARWRDLTDADLAAVRTRARELIERWRTLPVGGTLELPFTRAPG